MVGGGAGTGVKAGLAFTSCWTGEGEGEALEGREEGRDGRREGLAGGLVVSALGGEGSERTGAAGTPIKANGERGSFSKGMEGMEGMGLKFCNS